jgi:hypothetical protein
MAFPLLFTAKHTDPHCFAGKPIFSLDRNTLHRISEFRRLSGIADRLYFYFDPVLAKTITARAGMRGP